VAQHAEDAFGAGLRALVAVDRDADAPHGRVHPAQEQEEHRERPRGDARAEDERAGDELAADDHLAADDEDADERHAREHADGGEEHAPEFDGGDLLVVVGRRLAGHAVEFEVVAVERLDDLRAADVVLQAGVHARDGLPDALVPGFDPREEEGARQADDGNRRERDDSQRRRHPEQDGADAADRRDDADYLAYLVVEEPLEAVDVVVQYGHHRARLVVREEVQREVLHVVVRVVAEVPLYLLGSRLQQVPGDEPRHRAHDVGERGDEREAVEERDPRRLRRDCRAGDEAELGEQPRFARLQDDAVDGGGDDQRRDEPREPRDERGRDADGEARPVAPGVSEQAHHRVALDLLADVLEAAEFVGHTRGRRGTQKDHTAARTLTGTPLGADGQLRFRSGGRGTSSPVPSRRRDWSARTPNVSVA